VSLQHRLLDITMAILNGDSKCRFQIGIRMAAGSEANPLTDPGRARLAAPKGSGWLAEFSSNHPSP
jgi:hypothetical protein